MGSIYLKHDTNNNTDIVDTNPVNVPNEDQITIHAVNASFHVYFQNPEKFTSDIQNPIIIPNRSSITLQISPNAKDSIIYYTYCCSTCNVMLLEAPPKIIVGNIETF